MRKLSPLLFVLLALLVSGCQTTVDRARQSLTAVERTVTAAASALDTYDLNHQEEILKSSSDPVKVKEALAAYRSKRGKVVQALVETGAVCAAGHPLIDAVELGVRKITDLEAWIPVLLDAATKIVAALKEFGVTIPGLSAIMGPEAPAANGGK